MTEQQTLSIAGTAGYAPLRPTPERLAFYRRLAEETGARRTIDSLVIPRREGRAFTIDRGQILRITCTEGSQVADFIAFGRADLRERFWSGRTRVINGAHLRVGQQLWSTPPYTRPMLTLIADTVDHKALPQRARSHDLLFCRCDARHYELVHGKTGLPSCQENLAAAIAPFGLGPEAVHDPFNIFMTTGLNEEERPFYLPCDARKGDFVELHAEIDCLIAISACPGGSSGPVAHALGIDVFAPVR